MTTNLKVNTLNIAEKTIGPGHPCMIIAEAGVNHNGSEEMALDFVDIAHKVAPVYLIDCLKTDSILEYNR